MLTTRQRRHLALLINSSKQQLNLFHLQKLAKCQNNKTVKIFYFGNT